MGGYCPGGALAPLAAGLAERIYAVDREPGAAAAAQRAVIRRLESLSSALAADDDTRAVLGEAASRAEALVGDEVTDGRTGPVAFGGEAACALVLDRAWTPATVQALVDAVAASCGVTRNTAALEMYLRASRSPGLLELPPLLAAEAHLRLLRSLAPVAEVSLWLRPSATERPSCVALVGDQPTRRVREVAEAALDDELGADPARGSIHGVTITRWQQPVGAIVARGKPELRERNVAFLAEAGAALAPVLEREMLLERNADRERSLVAAGERRLLRLGFDLHDGPLQEVASLRGEVALLSTQIDSVVPSERREIVSGRFADLEARVVELDRTLRELSQSLESTSALERPLERVLEREVKSFRRRTYIDADLMIVGDMTALTRSQKLVIFRAVQEALSNAREHSGAERVEVSVRSTRTGVEVSVLDDGRGFDVGRTLQEAAQRGRLGVVGISERVRLLGGSFDIDSRPGGPTSLVLTLPRWEPVVGAAAVGATATAAAP